MDKPVIYQIELAFGTAFQKKTEQILLHNLELPWNEYFDTICDCSVVQLYPILCDPMDYNPPGSSIHGMSQAKILEWVAISFSRGSSQPRDQTCFGRWMLYHWVTREAFNLEPLYYNFTLELGEHQCYFIGFLVQCGVRYDSLCTGFLYSSFWE